MIRKIRSHFASSLWFVRDTFSDYPFVPRMSDNNTPDQAKLREASSSLSQIIPAPTARSLPKRAPIDPSTLPRVLTNQVLFSIEDSMDEDDEVQESLGEASKRGAETSEEG